jgi:hypothetical protein
VASLRAPDAVGVPPRVGVINQVVEINHLYRTVADVVLVGGVIVIDALLSCFVPAAGEELGGDGHFFLRIDHLFAFFVCCFLGVNRFGERTMTQTIPQVNIYF